MRRSYEPKSKVNGKAIALAIAGAILACGTPAGGPTAPAIPRDRESAIPPAAVKMSPTTDANPPVMQSNEFDPPVPLPGPINTAGAEDSPFLTIDGRTFYFFFTPDVTVPVERQVTDGVTGIYRSDWTGNEWSIPARVVLQEPGKAAGDGCEFVLGDTMWFCSVREGFSGLHWFKAVLRNGVWQDWQVADFDPDYQVGELHISRDGSALYFGSERPGGEGGLDLWVSMMAEGAWQPPIPLATVNTSDSEGWPALNAAGDELWFTRNYGVWRSKNLNGEWSEPELIVSPLAGEPTLDQDGNLYFVHHFFSGDTMIEADIYVAYRR
jgi:hypothetical protein